MKWNLKREIFPFAIIALFVILSLYFYSSLPAQVPSHFDFHGKVDQYSSKGTFIALYLGMSIGLYLLLTFIPMIDPFWKKIQSKYHIFLIFRDMALVFFFIMYIIIIYAARHGQLEPYLLGIALGLLFIFMGNYLPKLPRNFFFGIRNPWTLASEEVWRRTHILGGWLFVISGILAVLLSVFKVNPAIALGATFGPAVLYCGLIYPLWLYKKLQHEERSRSPQL